LVDQRLGLCKNLSADHWFILEFAKPLQMIPADEQFEGEQAEQTSDNLEATSTSSQPKPTIQTSDPSVLEDLSNHYKGELPGFQPNLEKASETAPDTSVISRLSVSEYYNQTCQRTEVHGK
jgi:hypothetical protein